MPEAPILAADTTVALGRRILGKPRDAADATAMLSALSARTHRVLTAVAVATGRRDLFALSVSRVHFAALSATDVNAYVAGGEPFGKAGAYAIQGGAAAWIERIEGSYTVSWACHCTRPHGCCVRPRSSSESSVCMQDILINWTPQETRVAVVENGAVQELHIERALGRGRVGNIYQGKVARVLPGMQSAFVDIGLERAAFLHVADLHAGFAPQGNGGNGGSGNAPPPIERLVFEGQALTVQVVKDPIGTKGARLSTQISLAGRMLVHLPQDNHIGISQKIGSPDLREQLRQRMAALVGKPEEGGGGGFILRTNAEEASDTELGDDVGYLRKTWAAVRERAYVSPPGTLLHEDLSLVERVLRDLSNEARKRSASIRACSTNRCWNLAAASRRVRSPSSPTTKASGRSSTCSTSTRRSPTRWRAAST